MQTSLYTGISGINANLSELSVIGNNIANVNTVGFKDSRSTFDDILSQTLSGGSGTNQIGLGVKMATIQKSFSQGAFETTGNTLDLAVSGNGFFIVKNPTLGATYYSRAGQFQTDKDNYIVNPEGLRLQGYMADTTGTLQNTITDLQVSTKTIAPNRTANINLFSNLDSNAPITGFTFKTGVNDTISFSINGGPAITTSLITQGGLAPGAAYNGGSVAAAIKAAIEAVSGTTDRYTVNYNDQTGIFTVTNPATNANTITVNWPASNARTLLGYGAVAAQALAPGASDSGVITKVAGGAFDLAKAGETSNFSTPITVYDSLGNSHLITMYFRKSSLGAVGNNWEYKSVVNGTDSASGATEVQAQGTVTFNNNGAFYMASGTTYPLPSGGFDFTGGAAPGQKINFDFGTSIAQGGTGTAGTTQYGTASGVSKLTQDGYSSGTLQKMNVDKNGMVTGIFSNGRDLKLGQVLLADFPSPVELASAGNDVYTETFESGQPLVGSPGSSGRGLIQSQTLELSNVDIAEEFVKMIAAQRGFQANSKVITTTDELLQELVNIKR